MNLKIERKCVSHSTWKCCDTTIFGLIRVHWHEGYHDAVSKNYPYSRLRSILIKFRNNWYRLPLDCYST